jgi:hypothetical protein
MRRHPSQHSDHVTTVSFFACHATRTSALAYFALPPAGPSGATLSFAGPLCLAL